ncbi:MAG: SDR family NAD(P)-dependent oxidoreductase [Pseudomonadota bacterium]
MNVKDKTIVITGAASGIGRALALACAQRGAVVALADINHAEVLATQAQTGLPADRSSAHQLNVASLAEWQNFKAEVIAAHGPIDGIINNAGVTFAGSVEDTDYAQLERVMSINFMGMVYGSKEFLPLLKQRQEAFIANVSSVFGLYAMKNQSAYCASKFAIRGFTEVLAQELKDTSVSVCIVHPGHIGTNIVLHAHQQGNVISSQLSDAEQNKWANAFKATGMAPDQAAAIILDGLSRKKRKIVVGRDAQQGDRLSRLFPARYVDAVNKAAP